jgi:hypothetical protein
MRRISGVLAISILASTANVHSAGAPQSSSIESTNSQTTQSKPGIMLVGSAEMVGSRLRLTPATRQTVGAAWFLKREYVAAGFEMVFDFQITERGGLGFGAYRLAFVLQNDGPEAIAGRGSAGGFALGDGRLDPSKRGIPRSIAVFLETYRNGDGGDRSDNYVAICTNGAISSMRWPPRRLGVRRRLRIRLKDGRVHRARIRYKPPMMSFSLDDGEPEVHVPVDVRTVVDPSGYAWIGFTASTGKGFENHAILGWSFTATRPEVSSHIELVESNITFLPSNCRAGRNLCTPAQADVREDGPGRYHIVLPAHLPWPASIPNPANRTIEIDNAKGYVCLGISAPERCSGPAGMSASILRDRHRSSPLQPDGNLGALIFRSERGRTFFSVNGSERLFGGNEGFFEFNVTLK